MPTKKWVQEHRQEYNNYMYKYRKFQAQKAKWIANCVREGNLQKAQELLNLKPNLHFNPEIEAFVRAHET